MASTPCATSLEFMERLVTEFFSKSIHTILESRSSSSSSSSSSARPGEDWFNLQLRGNPAELEKVKQWRRRNAELLLVDVVVVSRKERQLQHERVVERWSIQHEIRKVGAIDMVAVSKKAYKKSIIVLRSLYATARMLPAYKLFRELSSSSSSCAGLSFSHRISPFMEPFTREEEAQMKGFSFSPVDTPSGRLCLSVSYLPALESVSLGPPPPHLMETELIPDYVGSPAIDRFKKFNSLPSSLQTCVPSSPGPVQKDLLRIDSAPVSSALHRPPKNNAHLGHGLTLSPFMPKALGSRELLRMGGFQISMALQKAVSLGKDGVGKLHRFRKSSCSSPRNPSSRSFSKLPVFDDEPEIYCPFAVDDEENVKVSAERIESLNGRERDSQKSEKGQLIVRKPEDCAIGTLLQMLKTAAPLNEDHSKLMRPSQALKGETGSQRAVQNQDKAMKLSNTDSTKIFKSRTTSDALQELQNYKQIKNWLLTTKPKGGSPTLTTPNSPKSITRD